MLILAGIFSFGAYRILTSNASRLMLHRDVIYPESAGIELALRAARTGHIYPHFQTPPFTPAIYGPGYYLAFATVARALHFGFFRLLVFARFGSFLAFLGLLALVFAFSRRQVGWYGAALAAVALAAGIDFSGWIACARPDLLALFFTILGLVLAAWPPAPGRVRLLAAGAACAAAWLIKQSFVAAPLAVLLWLLLRRRRRDAGIFLGACAAPALLTLAWLGLHQEPWLTAMLLLRHSVMQPREGWQLFLTAITSPANGLSFLLGLAGFVSARRRPEWSLPRWYFILAWTIPVWPIMQAGASTNYLFEGWTAGALLLPAAVDHLQAHWTAISPASKTLALGLLLFYGWQYQLPVYHKLIITVRGYGNLAPLRNLRVFTNDDYLNAHSRQPELLDPDLAHILALTGHFDETPILARLQGQVYDMLLLGNWGGQLPSYRGIPYYSLAEIRAIRRNYRSACVADEMTVWIPHGRAPALTRPEFGRMLGSECLPAQITLGAGGRMRVKFLRLPTNATASGQLQGNRAR